MPVRPFDGGAEIGTRIAGCIGVRERRSVVAVVTRALPEPQHAHFVASLVQSSRDVPCDLLFSTIHTNDPYDLAAITGKLKAQSYLFIEPDGFHPALNRLARRGDARFAVWGQPGPDTLYPWVGPDNFSIGHLATCELLKRGARRIAYIGATDTPAMQQRFLGYTKALFDNGLSFVAGRVLETVPAQGPVDVDAGFVAQEDRVAAAIAWAGDLPLVVYSAEPGLKVAARISIDMAVASNRVLGWLVEPEGSVRRPGELFPPRLVQG